MPPKISLLCRTFLRVLIVAICLYACKDEKVEPIKHSAATTQQPPTTPSSSENDSTGNPIDSGKEQQIEAPTLRTCSGTVIADYCWRTDKSVSGRSCSDICGGVANYDEKGTRDYIGSGGTLAQCVEVANGLGYNGTPGDAQAGTYVSGGYGCFFHRNNNGVHWLWRDPVSTTAESTPIHSGYKLYSFRICACKS